MASSHRSCIPHAHRRRRTVQRIGKRRQTAQHERLVDRDGARCVRRCRTARSSAAGRPRPPAGPAQRRCSGARPNRRRGATGSPARNGRVGSSRGRRTRRGHGSPTRRAPAAANPRAGPRPAPRSARGSCGTGPAPASRTAGTPRPPRESDSGFARSWCDQLGLLDQPVQHQRDQARRGLVPGDQELLAEPAHLVMGQLTVELGERHHRQHVVGQRVAAFVQRRSIGDQFVDQREDLAGWPPRPAPWSPPPRLLTMSSDQRPKSSRRSRGHAEQRGDHDRRKREREERHEVTLAVVAERPLPTASSAISDDVVVEAGERRRAERVLQHPPVTPMVGVVGRAEHAPAATARRRHRTRCATRPDASPRRRRPRGGRPRERRIVRLLDVQRTSFAKVPVPERTVRGRSRERGASSPSEAPSSDHLAIGTSSRRQYGIVPPSTGNMQPVMFRAASEASITATAATSSTVFGRLIADSELNTSISAS